MEGEAKNWVIIRTAPDSTLFVAVDSGCQECDESSMVIGVFSTISAAKRAAIDAERAYRDSDISGQHDFFVFGVPAIDVAIPWRRTSRWEDDDDDETD